MKSRGIYSLNSTRSTWTGTASQTWVRTPSALSRSTPPPSLTRSSATASLTGPPPRTIVKGGLRVDGNLTGNQKVFRARVQVIAILLPDLAQASRAQLCIDMHSNAELSIASGTPELAARCVSASMRAPSPSSAKFAVPVLLLRHRMAPVP